MYSKERRIPYFQKMFLFFGMLLIASSCTPIKSHAEISKHTISICIDGPDSGIYCGGIGDTPVPDFPVTIIMQNGGSLIRKTDGNGEVSFDSANYESGYSIDTDALQKQFPMCELFYRIITSQTSIACSLAGTVSF